jgi:hypothetical protein
LIVGRKGKKSHSQLIIISINLRRDSGRSIFNSYLYIMAVACSPISEFLFFIVIGLSLWVSFLLYMVTALCFPMGGLLYSDRVVPMGISPLYGDSSLLPYGRIPPLLYDDAGPIIHRYLLLYMVAGPCSPICGFFSLIYSWWQLPAPL